jgi:hypothetical protein
MALYVARNIKRHSRLDLLPAPRLLRTCRRSKCYGRSQNLLHDDGLLESGSVPSHCGNGPRDTSFLIPHAMPVAHPPPRYSLSSCLCRAQSPNAPARLPLPCRLSRSASRQRGRDSGLSGCWWWGRSRPGLCPCNALEEFLEFVFRRGVGRSPSYSRCAAILLWPRELLDDVYHDSNNREDQENDELVASCANEGDVTHYCLSPLSSSFVPAIVFLIDVSDSIFCIR